MKEGDACLASLQSPCDLLKSTTIAMRLPYPLYIQGDCFKLRGQAHGPVPTRDAVNFRDVGGVPMCRPRRVSHILGFEAFALPRSIHRILPRDPAALQSGTSSMVLESGKTRHSLLGTFTKDF
jgi:hypothetical protein